MPSASDMYLPRNLIAHLYQNLIKRTHAAAPPVLLLVALEPDALCAGRILTALLKRDYIPHKIQPIAGYGDLSRAAEELVRPMRTTDGGSGGVVVCLGVGGMVDLEEILGLDVDEDGQGGSGDVEVWVLDARRPWNLANVFGSPISEDPATGELVRRRAGVDKGKVLPSYQSSRGGIIVFDDGDIEEELQAERAAYCGLEEMPEVGEEEDLDDNSDDQDEEEPSSAQGPKKRKSWSEDEESGDDMTDDERPRQRRRSNSGGSIPSSPEQRPARRGLMIENQLGGSSDFSRSDSRSRSVSPSIAPPKEQSVKSLRRQLIQTRNKYTNVLDKYYQLGTSYAEPVSSLVYNLASELGREDNDLLWNAIVGVSSLELYGRTGSGVGLNPLSAQGGSAGWNGNRGEQIRSVLRDEVRRLNPITDFANGARDAMMGEASGVIPTSARSATDKSIRLSPEPRFLLLRHWSLYESMLHSPYLSAKLHIWSDAGQKRLAKLLAKMGVSLSECKQRYTHMDMELKRGLRERLLKFAPHYGLDGLVPPVGRSGDLKDGWGFVRCWGWKACLSAIDAGVILGAILEVGDAKNLNHSSFDTSNFTSTQDAHQNEVASTQEQQNLAQEHITSRFWTAYDALGSIDLLVDHITTAQHLHRAILRTGTALIEKRQIRHLRAFRMAVVKEGPDVPLFTHPGALTKLALWIAEAIVELNGTKGKNKGSELVMAGLDDSRGLYVVVGLGGGGATESAKERLLKREARIKAKEGRREKRRKEREGKREARRQRNIAAGLEEDEVGDDTEEEEEDSEEDSEDGDEDDSDAEDLDAQRGSGRNRFGNAFQEVVRETGARVRMDSFEACVIEIKKEDLSGFLERLSMKAVVG
ncbi:DNA replication initiation factor cdc45 [Neocucurbitaria cava]|uniref:DNA replication initiation factor cdc45 n=1 Tax=Neocucurbitaria cava TaxID=798079 RepID=A0A9W9CN76_9PLEO|nr:DNA replication initiation factor cdc45 [Neocucurbitaria cava]